MMGYLLIVTAFTNKGAWFDDRTIEMGEKDASVSTSNCCAVDCIPSVHWLLPMGPALIDTSCASWASAHMRHIQIMSLAGSASSIHSNTQTKALCHVWANTQNRKIHTRIILQGETKHNLASATSLGFHKKREGPAKSISLQQCTLGKHGDESKTNRGQDRLCPCLLCRAHLLLSVVPIARPSGCWGEAAAELLVRVLGIKAAVWQLNLTVSLPQLNVECQRSPQNIHLYEPQVWRCLTKGASDER